MHRKHMLWENWRREIERIYLDEYDKHDAVTRHFGDQMAFNKLVYDGATVSWFDPAYNYLCLWNPPYRDENGVVRMSAPPFCPVGMLHLAGGWKHFGEIYYQKGLLYRAGTYLTDNERSLLQLNDTSDTFR